MKRNYIVVLPLSAVAEFWNSYKLLTTIVKADCVKWALQKVNIKYLSMSE